MEKLQGLVSGNAQGIHGKTNVRLEKTGMEVPAACADVVPYRAGATIPWAVLNVRCSQVYSFLKYATSDGIASIIESRQAIYSS